MTDKQLGVLVDKYREMLESAIKTVEEALPSDAIVYSKDLFGNRIPTYPALDELSTMVSVMQKDVESLRDQTGV